MFNPVENNSDFKTTMINCLRNYDNSFITIENRVNDWLWITKSNRVIGEEIDDSSSDTLHTDFEAVLDEVSNFTDKLDKECISFYMITNYNDNSDKIQLRTDLTDESINIDNAEVNELIQKWDEQWNNYDNIIYKNQIRKMSEVLDPQLIDEIDRVAHGVFVDEVIGNLQKQLAKRGITERPDWDEIYEKLRNIKAEYRELKRGKEYTLYKGTPMAKEISKAEYDIKVYQLRDAIKHNIELKNEGAISGTI